MCASGVHKYIHIQQGYTSVKVHHTSMHAASSQHFFKVNTNHACSSWGDYVLLHEMCEIGPTSCVYICLFFSLVLFVAPSSKSSSLDWGLQLL